MKELTSTSANFITRIPDENEPFVAEAEVVLIVSEAKYKIGSTGEVQKERICETVRFVVTAENLRKLGKQFARYAEAAETNLSEALREHNAAAVKPVTAQDTPPAP